jgi:hypothetical protein
MSETDKHRALSQSKVKLARATDLPLEDEETILAEETADERGPKPA